MLHSASRNNKGVPRMITNPPVSLRQPFEYSRSDKNYSLVERKTLLELGVDPMQFVGNGGYSFIKTTERQAVVPERLKVQAQWKAEADARLAASKA
jgi:hypothetical protein